MDRDSPTSGEGAVVRCPQCGNAMDVCSVGLLRKRRGVCPHCGTSQDLPDLGQRQTPAGAPDTASSAAPSTPEADSLVEDLEHQLWMTQVSTEVTRQDTRVRRRLNRIPYSRRSAYYYMRREEILSESLLGPQDVIRLAGGAIPAEERRRCPACDAVVAKDQARCEWCGAALPGDEEE